MSPPPALQAERTALAWERTALAALASGVLLVLRHLGAPGSGALVLGVLGLALALLVAVLGARRSRGVLADPAAPGRARRSSSPGPRSCSSGPPCWWRS